MKLGLGLSLPGVAAMGGKPAYRLYASAEFWIDARLNPASGTPVDLTANARTITVGGTPTFSAGSHWVFNGSTDYFEMADDPDLDFSGTDSFTAMVVFTQTGTSAATYMAKRTTVGNSPSESTRGWVLYNPAGGNLALYRGDNAATIEQDSGTWTSGAKTVLALRRTPTTADVTSTATTGSESAITAGDLSNSQVLRIGRLAGAGTQYSGLNLHAAMLWRRALTAAELASIRADFGA